MAASPLSMRVSKREPITNPPGFLIAKIIVPSISVFCASAMVLPIKGEPAARITLEWLNLDFQH